MSRIPAMVVLLFLGVMIAPLPSNAAVKDHALYKFGATLLSPSTYLRLLGKAEYTVDVVHVATSAVAKGAAEVDKAVAYLDTELEKLSGEK